MMPAMPMYLMKLPGEKKLPNIEPMAPRPDWSLGPTTDAMPENASPMGPNAALALPATLEASEPSPLPNDWSDVTIGLFSKLNAMPANAEVSLVLNGAVMAPILDDSWEPSAETFCPSPLLAIFSPASWNGKAMSSAMVFASIVKAVNPSLSWPGNAVILPARVLIPLSLAPPSRSKTPVTLSMLPPMPANRANAPAREPSWETRPGMVTVPSASPWEKVSRNLAALST